MNTTREFILRSEIRPETDNTVILECFSDTREIGKKKEMEGKITFNPDRCHMFFVPPVSISQAFSLPDRSRWDLYLLIIPFTLHKASDERYYEEVTFFIEMADSNVTAFDLLPKSIITATEERRSYTISPQTRFIPLEKPAKEADICLSFETLRPIITASGEGESVFYWTHKGAQEQKEVIPETKYAIAILQVPVNLSYVEATIEYEVITVRKLFGMWKRSEGETNPYTIRWNLPHVSPFVALPAKERSPGRQPLRVFLAYAPEDEEYAQKLIRHMSILQQHGVITLWSRCVIKAGRDYAREAREYLEQADLLLALISANFFAYDEFFALEKQESTYLQLKCLRTIPILLRPSDWTHSSFGRFTPLPANGKPITVQKNQDAAFLLVVQGIRAVIDELSKSS